MAKAVAKAPYNQAIQGHYKTASTTAATHIALAQQLVQAGRHEQAIAECDAALSLEPNNAQAQQIRQLAVGSAAAEHLARAQTLFGQQQYNPALAECDQALHFDPQNRDAAALKARVEETKKVLGYQ